MVREKAGKVREFGNNLECQGILLPPREILRAIQQLGFSLQFFLFLPIQARKKITLFPGSVQIVLLELFAKFRTIKIRLRCFKVCLTVFEFTFFLFFLLQEDRQFQSHRSGNFEI